MTSSGDMERDGDAGTGKRAEVEARFPKAFETPNKTVAVYDLGGGTFDISILEIGAHGVFKVIATTGDTFLGGEDFDARIIDWLVQGFKDEHDIDLRQDRMALQRLRDAAEKAKCELSQVREAEVNLPFIISTGRNEALHLQRTLTRETLERLTEDLVERTVDICKQALADARLDIVITQSGVVFAGLGDPMKLRAPIWVWCLDTPS